METREGKRGAMRLRPRTWNAAGAADRPVTRSVLLKALVLLGTIALTFLSLSCSPDLREAVGPLTPYPNVEGAVGRDGSPLVNHRVRLVETVSDSTVHKTHTNLSGHYGFAYVGTGDWTIKISSDAPDDTTEFSDATYEFVFASQDTSLVLPGMDLGARGASLLAPPSGAAITQPSFLDPLTFQWTPCADADLAEVRVYDSAGSVVWISGKTNSSTIPWNGLCNRGAGSGQSVPPGDYTWRMRFQTGGSAAPVEYTTAPRAITVQGAAR